MSIVPGDWGNSSELKALSKYFSAVEEARQTLGVVRLSPAHAALIWERISKENPRKVPVAIAMDLQ